MAKQNILLHENNGSECMFAYVHKTDHKSDNYGQIYFKKLSNFQFIEVIGIDRCVGFLKLMVGICFIFQIEKEFNDVQQYSGLE